LAGTGPEMVCPLMTRSGHPGVWDLIHRNAPSVQNSADAAAKSVIVRQEAAQMETMIMRREWLVSVGAVLLAFLGTQHHNLMMLLFAVGLGNASMSLMTKLPVVRDVMLAMSLVMAAIIAYQISRPSHPTGMRITGMLSIIITLGLAGWSVLQFGL
jgi:hypothetical protein